MRQPVGPRVQLGEAQRRSVADDGEGVRGPPYLRGEQLADRAVRYRMGRRVPLAQHPVPLRRAEQRQPAEPAVGVGRDPGEHGLQVPGQPFDGGGVEERRVVVERRGQLVSR